MTATVAATPQRRRRRRTGWRGPQYPGEFPSLGWAILDWTYAYLPSPANEKEPLVYTDEQARRIVRWFEIDAETGEFPNTELVLEEAKGWGKSPFAGSLMLAALRGPVCFDGWDANGEPVAVPRGTGDRPPPWIQIAAVSEDQTDNTYGALYAMLVANDHKAARDLNIDDGRTRLYLPDMPGAVLEPVTAAYGSREGQRITDAVLDESWLWKPTNGGIKLARTIRRNLAKMGGRSVETTNAPILGERSVAEQNNPDIPTPGVLHFATRPPVEPDTDWTDDQLRDALRHVYGNATWVDLDRLIREMRDPKNPWDESLRFWFNLRQAGAGRAIDPRLWDARLAERPRPPAGTRIGAAFDGSISQDATVIRCCTEDGYSFLWEAWEKPTGAELQRWLDAHPDKSAWEVDRLEVEQSVAELFATYDVGLFLCDTPKWRTEIETWADRYAIVDENGKRQERVEAFDTNQERRFAPAVDRWTTGLREGTHTHDADPLTDRHVKAAHRRKTRATGDETDGRTMWVLVKGDDHGRIDGAVTDVLAFEAAMTMPPATPPAAPPSIW